MTAEPNFKAFLGMVQQAVMPVKEVRGLLIAVFGALENGAE
nr:hypothetical protein I308_05061 [Cryptococcus tetragattii IND107]